MNSLPAHLNSSGYCIIFLIKNLNNHHCKNDYKYLFKRNMNTNLTHNYLFQTKSDAKIDIGMILKMGETKGRNIDGIRERENDNFRKTFIK